MLFLLVCAVVILIVLVALALSQAGDVNRRLNAYLRELNRVDGLASRIERIERELSRLAGGGAAGGAEVGPGHPPVEARPLQPPPSTVPAGPFTAPGAAPAAAPGPGPQPPSVPVSGPIHVRAPALRKPSRTRAEWEAFVGGKLLNRIGALALILGVGFFLKYAFDNEWISETVRVLIGASAGLACLAAARRTRAKGLPVFAQGLVGSGVAILYLSVYASFNYYHLVPQWVAVVLMSVVTALTFAHGASYDSLAVGLLGWAGGFLTPFLLATGTPNETGLFTYIVLLDAAIAALALRKAGWAVLAPLAMAATWLTWYAWYWEYYAPSKLWPAFPFAAAFWLLFHAADLAMRGGTSGWWPRVRHLMPGLNAGLFYYALYDILEAGHHEWTAPATLALAALFLATALRAPGTADDRARNLLITAVLVVLATAVQYTGHTTVILWSLEAALLAWCGTRWRLDYLMTAAVILSFVTGVKFAGTDGTFHLSFPGEIGPVVNLRNLAYLVFASALGACARLYRRSAEPSAPLFAAWLASAASVVVFTAATVTVVDVFSHAQALEPPVAEHDLSFRRLMAIACTWAVYSIPFVWVGLASRRNTTLVPGLVALLLGAALVTIRGAAFSPIEMFTPLLNVRTAAFAVLLFGIAVHSALVDSYRGAADWLPEIRGWLGIAAGVALLSLLTGETRDYFGHRIASGPRAGAPGHDPALVLRLENLRQLSISGAWLAYSAALMALGIWKDSKGLRFFAIGLFGLTILKIFVYDLSFLETLYRIFSFVGLGVILLAVSYAYQRYKRVLFGEDAPGPPAG